MQQDLSFEHPSKVNSSLTNFSSISIDHTKVIQTTNAVKDDKTQENQLKNQGPKDQFSMIGANASYLDDSRIQPIKNKANNGIADKLFSKNSAELDFDEINKSGFQFNVSKRFSKSNENSKIINQKEEQSLDDTIKQFNEIFTETDEPDIDTELHLDESSIQIKQLNDNSFTQAFIQKNVLDQIKIQVSVTNNKESPLSIHPDSNNLQIKNLINLHQQAVSVNSQKSENIQYNGSSPNYFPERLKNNNKISKEEVFQKRKLIKEMQQSIVLRLEKAERSDNEKKTQKKEDKKSKKSAQNLPTNQQNLKIMNQMFCSNQNVVKKRYKGLSTKYYNFFYIDEQVPFHNRYILNLSANTDAKMVGKLKQSDQKRQKYQQTVQKEEKLKMKKKQTNKNKYDDSQELQNLEVTEEKQKVSNNVEKQVTEKRKKYVEERNRKKAQKGRQLKRKKQEMLKLRSGCIKQEIEKFNISMKVFTKISWEYVVYLIMKESQIKDQEFEYFVDKAHLFPNLMRMDFSKNKITDKGFTYFIFHSHKFQNMFDIYFEQNKITNYGIKKFSQSSLDFKFYKRIHLSDNLIDDEGYTFFFTGGKNYPNLVKIKFGGNQKVYKPMTCRGFGVFAQKLSLFKKLKQIYLYQNLISDQGLIQFSNRMLQLQSLMDLNLGNNKITFKGFDYFLSKILFHHQIRRIYMNTNNIEKIPQKSMKNLMEASSKLILLNLRQNPLESDENSRIFLVDVFLNMKAKFKFILNLHFPANLNLQKIKCDFQRLIQIINGKFASFVKEANNDGNNNQMDNQEIQEPKAEKIQQQITVFRLQFLNLSQKNLTTQNWCQLVKSINNLLRLEELNLDRNNINTITLHQLNKLQQFVINRAKFRKKSRILKISLLHNKLDKQSLKDLELFIKQTYDRRVFVITSMKNELKQTQPYENSVIEDEPKAYSEAKFKIQIQTNLESVIGKAIVTKDFKKELFQHLFSTMFEQIIQSCGNQLKNYQKVKIMFSELYPRIKTSRVYPTKKNVIDRRWKIAESYFFSQIEQFCESIKNNQNNLEFNEEQMKSVILQLSKVKVEKQKTKPEQKKMKNELKK